MSSVLIVLIWFAWSCSGSSRSPSQSESRECLENWGELTSEQAVLREWLRSWPSGGKEQGSGQWLHLRGVSWLFADWRRLSGWLRIHPMGLGSVEPSLVRILGITRMTQEGAIYVWEELTQWVRCQGRSSLHWLWLLPSLTHPRLCLHILYLQASIWEFR